MLPSNPSGLRPRGVPGRVKNNRTRPGAFFKFTLLANAENGQWSDEVAYSVPWDLLGIAVSGDIGAYTIYTDRFGRKVPFLKSPPKEPCSPAQAALRASFKEAQAEWAALQRWEKAILEEACRLTSIPLTGQNLWIHCRMKNDWSAYATIERQSGLTLPAHTP